MFLEVRNELDFEYFQKMIRYANLMKSKTCLKIEFYWNFQPKSYEAELEEAQRLVDILMKANGYAKLSIGADGLRSRYLPKVFLKLLVEKLSEKKTVIEELCFDLKFFGVLGTACNPKGYPNSTEFLDSIGEILVDNLHIKTLAFMHGHFTTLSGFFRGIQT